MRFVILEPLIMSRQLSSKMCTIHSVHLQRVFLIIKSFIFIKKVNTSGGREDKLSSSSIRVILCENGLEKVNESAIPPCGRPASSPVH